MNTKITQENSGQRLDKFLVKSGALPGMTRNQIQKLIKQKLVRVGGLAVSPHYNLKAGEAINLIEQTAETTAPASPKETRENYNISIIDQTAEFLVINKPAGLVVHGASGDTLADWLKEKYPKIKKVGDDPERPGLVHRLDKDTSGLMVIAKTQDSFNNLKKQFQDRTIDKQYAALAYGKIQKDSGVINFPVARAKDGYKMAALPLTVKGQLSDRGRPAETRFWVMKKFINYTLLKIKIITGRTHQIRVHLAAYDHPLVGDNIYGTAKTRAANKKLGLNRIFLIADRLAFTDLAGEPKSYKINLSQDLKNILKQTK